MSSIFTSIKTVLSDRRYLAGSILIAAVIFSVLFVIQVKTVPGNSGPFQIAIFIWKDWAILIAIAVFNSLFITIEIYGYVLSATLFLLLFSLYLIGRRFDKICLQCQINLY